ncbi:hypothetical protein AALP_AA1G349200 [Arabis alpina]|uniref:Uncharacterized protein n=1 Tax=Arabis alpina TaxID=50452 RepID=A0A087HSP1_ARAAL|nr:hypothetical protein AALP_AA1G349200 [Arabis alpina]
MTDKRRIADPKDVAPWDLEDGEISTDRSTREDQTARDDPPPARPARANPPTGEARANPPGEKSKEVPTTTVLVYELLQKMNKTLDSLLVSAERQNKANQAITNELKSLGADYRIPVLEPDVDDNEDLARRVVPDTELTESKRARQATTKGSNADPRQAASQQFSTLGDDDPAKRVVRDTKLRAEEMARRATTRAKHADPQRTTQQRFSTFDDEIGPEYTRHISKEEENAEWVEQAEVVEAKQAAIRALQDEITEFRASLSKTTADLKSLRSQMRRASSKTPEIDLILEQAHHNPFLTRITKARVSDPGKIRVPSYDDGTKNRADHLNEFNVAITRANFKE